MVDINGNTPMDDAFYTIDNKTWIRIAYCRSKVGKTDFEDLWIYQKIANSDAIPYCQSSKDKFDCMDYKQWREFMTGMTWADLIHPFVKQAKESWPVEPEEAK